MKTNPVLVALQAGRFPDVRPNYDYFAHLLALDSAVAAKPKTCWVFVSSPHVSLDEDKTLRGQNGTALDAEEFPQLARAVNEEGILPRGPDGSVLLHEYTSGVEQSYSGAVRDVTKHWETSFPGLYGCLNLPEPQDEDSLTILEMTVSLELHRSAFPAGSELNGVVEMSIAAQQPALQNSRWKCVTRLARPRELCPEAEAGGDDDDDDGAGGFLEHTDEVGVQFVHQTGCGDGRSGCDCMTRPRQDIRVPFPAAEWAGMLTNCASYPEGLPQESGRRRSRAAATGSEGDDDDSCSGGAGGAGQEPTQAELISRIGMFQELWSSPHASSSSSSSCTWTRRAVIFWRFRDVHKYNARKKKWVAEAPSAQWRYLTVNDPTSEYHMRNAYLPPVAAAPSAGGVLDGCLPPKVVFDQGQGHGQYQHQQQQQYSLTSAAPQSHFAPGADFMAWNMSASVANHFTTLAGAAAGLPVLDMCDGMTSPPLPGSLSDQFPSFEAAHHDLAQHMSFFAASCGGTSGDSQDGSLLGDMPPSHLGGADDSSSFLQDGMSAAGSVAGLMYEDVKCDPALQAWGHADVSVAGLEACWPATAGEFDAALAAGSVGTTPEWKVEGPGAAAVWSSAAAKDVSWAPAVHIDMQGGGHGMHDVDASLAGHGGPRGVKRPRPVDLEAGHGMRDMERMERPARRIKRELGSRRVAGQA